MYRATEILPLQIRDIKKGECCGNVKNILFDAGGNNSYIEIEKKSLGQAEVLAISDVIGIGTDYLLIKKKDFIKRILSADKEMRAVLRNSYVLLGVEVIEGMGTKLGKIVDLEINKSGVLSKIFLESGEEIEKNKIISICDTVVFVNLNDNIMEDEESEEDEELEMDEMELPLGLTVGKKVTSADGTFEIKKGTVITEKIIDEASQHDVLVDLALSAQ